MNSNGRLLLGPVHACGGRGQGTTRLRPSIAMACGTPGATHPGLRAARGPTPFGSNSCCCWKPGGEEGTSEKSREFERASASLGTWGPPRGVRPGAETEGQRREPPRACQGLACALAVGGIQSIDRSIRGSPFHPGSINQIQPTQPGCWVRIQSAPSIPSAVGLGLGDMRDERTNNPTLTPRTT